MRLRILHVSQPVEAGVPRVAADLIADQAARGWEVIVACPPGGRAWDELDPSSYRIEGWSARRSPGPLTLFEASRLARIIRAAEPDIVHLHSAKAGLAGRLALRGRRPTVFQPHAWSFEAATGILRRGAVAWERKAATWTDALVCVSRAEADVGRELGISAPYEVVPNGVDLGTWTDPHPDDRSSARAELDLDQDAEIVVCVGRLSHQKGQDVLLDAWPEVTGARSGTHLYLVGDGPEAAKLSQREVFNVEILGDRSDVRGWLIAADLVVMPSRWEGMSLAMLEAMACARCVIATDVPGAREVLRDDAGVVVPVEDHRALAEQVIRLLGAPRLRADLGRAARRRIETEHDAVRVRDRIASIYGQVLERRRAYR